ncbi:hypothetical protein EJ08DRAFT_739625 [Tothia fuscella]|uniref:Uncharacterized protein n=1 Tax=Tothia fuscella TaxID=1048955 RepID=A0A9P4TSI0_9PEZI|nr:hypothetical protein EJ08DRAFT_739625 [Tothia fuscella]
MTTTSIAVTGILGLDTDLIEPAPKRSSALTATVHGLRIGDTDEYLYTRAAWTDADKALFHAFLAKYKVGRTLAPSATSVDGESPPTLSEVLPFLLNALALTGEQQELFCGFDWQTDAILAQKVVYALKYRFQRMVSAQCVVDDGPRGVPTATWKPWTVKFYRDVQWDGQLTAPVGRKAKDAEASKYYGASNLTLRNITRAQRSRAPLRIHPQEEPLKDTHAPRKAHKARNQPAASTSTSSDPAGQLPSAAGPEPSPQENASLRVEISELRLRITKAEKDERKRVAQLEEAQAERDFCKLELDKELSRQTSVAMKAWHAQRGMAQDATNKAVDAQNAGAQDTGGQDPEAQKKQSHLMSGGIAIGSQRVEFWAFG